MVGVGIWAEYELDQDILQSFSSAKNATDIMGDLRNTVGHQWPGRSSVGGVTNGAPSSTVGCTFGSVNMHTCVCNLPSILIST